MRLGTEGAPTITIRPKALPTEAVKPVVVHAPGLVPPAVPPPMAQPTPPMAQPTPQVPQPTPPVVQPTAPPIPAPPVLPPPTPQMPQPTPPMVQPAPQVPNRPPKWRSQPPRRSRHHPYFRRPALHRQSEFLSPARPPALPHYPFSPIRTVDPSTRRSDSSGQVLSVSSSQYRSSEQPR